MATTFYMTLDSHLATIRTDLKKTNRERLSSRVLSSHSHALNRAAHQGLYLRVPVGPRPAPTEFFSKFVPPVWRDTIPEDVFDEPTMSFRYC